LRDLRKKPPKIYPPSFVAGKPKIVKKITKNTKIVKEMTKSARFLQKKHKKLQKIHLFLTQISPKPTTLRQITHAF
jgi:hypothetical protein